jgi:hypothetical protein
MKRYIHRLYDHELGYRGGYSAGKRKGAGSYIYVPKTVARNFFPPLRDNVLNDSVALPLEFTQSGRIALVRYVYHNDKNLNLGTRDEYRIYLAPALAHEHALESPGNILVFLNDENSPPRYSVRILKQENKDTEWRAASESLGRGNHALESGSYQMPPPPRGEKAGMHVPQDVLDYMLENPIVFAKDEKAVAESTRALRDRAFRETVLRLYDLSCCITETTIRHDALTNIEAAHIVPHAQLGSDSPVNGMAMSRDVHWAFDHGFFTVTREFSVAVHPRAIGQVFLKRIDAKQIRMPRDKRAKPHPDALDWHRKHVYGKFCRE